MLLDSSRCNAGGSGGSGGGDYLYKDFDGSLTSGGWKTFWSGTNPNIGSGKFYLEQSKQVIILTVPIMLVKVG